MTKGESRLANKFLKQPGIVKKGSARTASLYLADFGHFVKQEYRENLDSLVEELRSGKRPLPSLFKVVTYESRERIQKPAFN
jgi:hypothetical protein